MQQNGCYAYSASVIGKSKIRESFHFAKKLNFITPEISTFLDSCAAGWKMWLHHPCQTWDRLLWKKEWNSCCL